MEDAQDRLAALLAEHEITINAVPAIENPHLRDGGGVHFQVLVKRSGRRVLSTFYSAGAGIVEQWARTEAPAHIRRKARKPRGSADHREALAIATKAYRPTAVDVVGCLLLESDAIDCSFEEWADALGYDSDSRSAERIYRICREHALELRGALGSDAFDRAREMAAEL